MNRLEWQADHAREWPAKVDAWHDGRDVLLDEFASLNGVKRATTEPTLDAIVRGLRSGGAWGRCYEWPGCDHPVFFKRDGRAAMAVTEPYATLDVDALRAYAAEHGLAFHTPPNPRASMWYPPHTYFIALTAPDFGPVRWHPHQLSYRGSP